MEFSGKTVFVTGAGSGIGRATALLLLQNGANVACVDRDRANLGTLLDAVRAHAGRALLLEADVTDPLSVDAAVAKTVAQFGGLDHGVNNAGVLGDPAKIADMPVDMMRRVFEVNVFGILHCMKAELAVMLRRGSGAIVNTASVAGLIGGSGRGAYSASKHAVIGLTKSAALDHIRAGVRINCVCPGLIPTPLADELIPGGDMAAAGKIHPIGRLGRPEEIADAIAWLLSDRATFVVGAAVTIDGGIMAT